MIRGMPAAATEASAAARARSQASERADRPSERRKQCGGIALRRVPIVKGGGAVGWRWAGSPVRGVMLPVPVLVLVGVGVEVEEEGFFGGDGCCAWGAAALFASSAVDRSMHSTAAAAARPLRFCTLWHIAETSACSVRRLTLSGREAREQWMRGAEATPPPTDG